MTRLSIWLFGVLMPGLEILLVMAGLALLGWQGAVYTVTGVWTTVPLGAIDWLSRTPAWIAALPLSGVCIGAGIALFFIMPPAYAHSD